MLTFLGTVKCVHDGCTTQSVVSLSINQLASFLNENWKYEIGTPKWLPQDWSARKTLVDMVYLCPAHK